MYIEKFVFILDPQSCEEIALSETRAGLLFIENKDIFHKRDIP